MKKIVALTLGLVLTTTAIIFGPRYFQTPEEPCTFPQVYSINDIQDELAQADSSTFVFFDCDDTLITASDFLPRTFVLPLPLKILTLIKHPSLFLDPKAGENLFSIMLEKAPRKLTEPALADVIKKLHTQGAHVLGITGMETGKFGVIESMPAWRATMLKDFGIVLSNEFENITFDQLPRYRNNAPVLYNGLICCNQQAKGTLIGAFLDHFKLRPSTIVLVDDSHEELVSLQEECTRRHIKAICYHYKATSHAQHKPFRLWHALKQIDHLFEHHAWLADI
ncbi:DUF2608 domain-containing protein [bacterium]|nr:MAG: DUF2608 domain-containing protein [bacterium]